MKLRSKLINPSLPLVFFEQVPPAVDNPEALKSTLAELAKVRPLVDGINIPEIRDEGRQGDRTYKFIPRLEPRVLAKHIQAESETHIIVNRVVVHEPDQLAWFRQTGEEFGINDVVVVGGESSSVTYPGPGVGDVARQVLGAGLPFSLGGISIPSRNSEAERVRRKHAAGLTFFTTQVLFDSNDVVWMLQRLNGLRARIFLSFCPVSHPGDLKFLRWLGADVPKDLDRFLLHSREGESASAETCFDRSLNLAQRILMDVFDNLPPDPPAIGLNIEHINRRNYGGAIKMLDSLGALYTQLLARRFAATNAGSPRSIL